MRRMFTVFLILVGATMWTPAAMAQLSGSYDIGGADPDYANFTAAAADLTAQGVSGAVTFNVYGGDYDDTLSLGAITGASDLNTITFVDVPDGDNARLAYTGAERLGVVHFNGTDYVTLDGIDIACGVGTTKKCLRIEGTAQHNRFKNATWTALGPATSTSYVVYMIGPNNDDNIFYNLNASDAREIFRLTSYSGASQQSLRNMVDSCRISNGYYCVYADYQDGLHVRNCDMQPNASASGMWGLYLSSMVDGDTVYFYGNKVHNIVGSGNMGMVYTSTGGLSRYVYIYNNFCYGYANTALGSPRPIYVSSGTHYIYFNNIQIDHVPVSSGYATAAIYTSGSSTASYDIRNNVFALMEPDSYAFGIYQLSTPASFTLDHNCYYGTGARFHCADLDSPEGRYTTIADLRNGTPYEDHGVQGDPGYVSTTDLHIQNTYGLLHLNGAAIPGITTDIDGDTRLSSPDIGADEYTYLAPANDYAVREFVGWTWLNPELTAFTSDAWVQNRGSANQTDVKVVFYYDGLAQDSELVSLNAYESDTITFNWTTPAAPDTVLAEAQSYLAADAVPDNDSATVSLRIVGMPMHGTYDIGGATPDYDTFNEAVGDLIVRQIDDAVIFDVYSGTYNETVSIPAITGASASYTITFRDASALLDPPLLSGSGTYVLYLNGASYITFDGINVTNTANGQVIRLGAADYNTIKNCTVTANGTASSSNYGLYVYGGGSDYNVFDNITVNNAYYPIYLSGASGTRDVANEVKNCSAPVGKYGVYLTYQNGAIVHDCDIQPGWSGAATEVAGIYATTHAAGERSIVYNNKIHNIRTSGTNVSNGIYASTGSGVGFLAYNNWIYDYVVTGTGALYGLRAAGGSPEFYFNSVWIGDVGTTGGTTGISGSYVAGSSTVATLKNNIIRVDEDDNNCYGIYRSAGTLTSDYNCVFSLGPSATYNMGRDGTTNCVNLAAWQTQTDDDDNSKEGDPGFLSAADLHLQPSFNLCDSTGVTIAGITTDIDGQVRTDPDIGSDEYDYAPPSDDYGAVRFIGLASPYTAYTPVVIQVEFRNYGDAQTNVPVKLFYEGVMVDSQALSLAADESDTVNFNWTTPDVGISFGQLEAQAFLTGDVYPDNDSVLADVIVYGGPMSGDYDLGGGNMDFENFYQATYSLILRGVDGPVTIHCYEGTYTENVTIPAITGAAYPDTILFKAHETALLDVDNVVVTASGGGKVLYLNGADYISFDGVNFTATGSCDTVIVVRDDVDTTGAQHNRFMNLTITGRDSVSTGVRGVTVGYRNNDDLVFDGVTWRRCTYGVRYEKGATSNRSRGFVVKNSTILDARYGLMSSQVGDVHIHDNDIQPGSAAGGVASMGIYISSLPAADTAYVYNNLIHNLRNGHTSNFYDVVAVYTSNAGNDAAIYIYNNFIYDFTVPNASVRVMYLVTGNGTSYVYNNSIRINDVGSVDSTTGIYVSTGTAEIVNNIIVNEEATAVAYGIWKTTGSTISRSDYNCFYGPGADFRVGRDGGTDYASLAAWQGTGRDIHGVVGDPGYTSATDLHIQNTVGMVADRGESLWPVLDDIDGDLRDPVPDLGADEYDYQAPPNDYSVLEIIDPQALYPELSAVSISARVFNRGSANQTDVPIRLFYNDALVDTFLLSLDAGEIDTADFTWNTPAAPSSGLLEVQSFLAADADPTNDSATASTAILGQDYAVLEMLDPQLTYPQLTAVTISGVVQNQGSATQTNIPVRLFYQDVVQDSELVTLTAGEIDTFEFTWNTGTPSNGLLKIQTFLPNDQDPPDDSVSVQVYVVGPPMHGSYDLGGGANDYATFSAAIFDMWLRTIDGAVTFNVYPGTYNESGSIPEITGASSDNTITFQATGALDDPPLISSPTSPAVQLDGADWITFDGIDITITVAGKCVEILNDANDNAFMNATVTGASLTSTSSYGIAVSGGIGNDRNLFENLTVSGCYYGFRLYGSSSGPDQNNEVRDCTIPEAQYAFYMGYQEGVRIHDNRMQPGHATASGFIAGVYFSTMSAGDTAFVYANRMYNFRGGISYCYGIQWGSTNGYLLAYNNFVSIGSDVTSGTVVAGVYQGSGTAAFHFNSVRIGDVGATTGIYAYYSGSSTTSTVSNNIFEVDEPTGNCWAIYKSSSTSTLTSDYNDLYGTGAAFNTGRDGTTNYATLGDWQTHGFDAHSLSGDPVFVSTTDLHIQNTATFVDGMGNPVTGIETDIDGDGRDTPPDIGADEYDVLVAPDPVTDLTVYRDGMTDDVTLRWSATTGAVSYKIYAGNTYDFEVGPLTLIGTTGGLSFTHSGIVPTETFQFYVVLASTDPALVVTPPSGAGRGTR